MVSSVPEGAMRLRKNACIWTGKAIFSARLRRISYSWAPEVAAVRMRAEGHSGVTGGQARIRPVTLTPQLKL